MRAIVALNFKVPRPWSWISRVNQGQGYPKHFKGFSRVPLKTLEFQGKVEGEDFKGGENQDKGWMLQSFEYFSRNFKESSKFLEALMTNKRIVGIS